MRHDKLTFTSSALYKKQAVLVHSYEHAIILTMSSRRNFALGVINCLILIALADDECDQTQCRGPLKYFKDLNCKPIFKNPGDCCPYQFNCDHLKERPIDKCRIKNYDYNIGDALRVEDGNPCDMECMCIENNGIAQFTCAEIDCPHIFWPTNDTCYEPQKATECCGGQIICPEKPEDRPTCEVDGKIYKDGEYFKPASEPEKDCYCGPGYKGENIKPFCITSAYECGSELFHAYDIYHKCAPVYYSSQSPQKHCSLSFRCQNKRDKIIKRDGEEKNLAKYENITCEFGNMVMYYGDELNQATHYDSVCVRCVCEVGPVPTCQRLPDNECDVTKHPNFNTEEYQSEYLHSIY